MRPDQLSNMINNIQPKYFFEDDLSKQDRQTDECLIRAEMMIYKYLGMKQQLVDLWFNMHKQWRLKSKYSKSTGHWQRLSGQATTALGNIIVNLLVHKQFVKANYTRILKYLGLGDDVLVML